MFDPNPAPAGFPRTLAAAALAGLLLVSILFAVVPPARADGGQTRTDAKTGIGVTLPAGWEFAPDDPDHTFSLQRSDNHNICGYLSFFAPEKSETSREHTQGLLETMKKFTPEATFSEVTDTTLAGLPAATFTQADTKETMVEVVLMTQDKEVELTLWAPNELMDSMRGEFDQIRSSVTLP